MNRIVPQVSATRVSSILRLRHICSNSHFLPSCRRANRSLLPFRSFSHSHGIRNAAAVPPKASGQATAPPVSPAPAKPSRFRFLRPLRHLRLVPYKTLLALFIALYVYDRIDSSVRDSIIAILTQFTVPEKTWLYLNLNDLHVTESPHSDRALQILPFVSSTGKRRMTVLEMISTLLEAAHDPRIKGLIIAFNESMIEHRAILTGEVIESHLGMGVLNELQKALAVFRAAKLAQKMAEIDGVEILNVESPAPNDSVKPSEAVFVTPPEADTELAERGLQRYNPDQDVIIAIGDKYMSGWQYSLAATASRIFMQRSGVIQLTGMSIQQLFFGKLFEKYGIDFKVEARRDYKSAMAALSDSKWNGPTRKNLEELLASLQTQSLFDIYDRYFGITGKLPFKELFAESDLEEQQTLKRNAESVLSAIKGMAHSIGEAQSKFRESLDVYMNAIQKGPMDFKEAVKYGFIDGSGYHQDLLAALASTGVKAWSLRKYLDAQIAQTIFLDIDMEQWVIPQLLKKQGDDQGETGGKQRKDDNKSKEKKKEPIKLDISLTTNSPTPRYEDAALKVELVVPRKIGLIYIDSAIEGKGRFGGEATAAYILKAARDAEINSIVLRINSPGGDAIASDTIWRAVKLARKHKPVLASFGDIAASGGYYVAAGADLIISNAYTLTGSIGVISGWPVIKRLLDKVDITSDAVEFLPNAAWRHMELGLPDTEMDKLRRHVDGTYEDFKRVVSEGRKMSMEDVENLAQGQVYTGAQAQELGLVDSLGGLNDCLMLAGVMSLHKTMHGKDPMELRELMDEETDKIFHDAITGGDLISKLLRETLKASPHYKHLPEPSTDDIGGIIKRLQITMRPQAVTVIIPHVNLANEALSVAIGTAFQSDDERSPIPIDQPLVDPLDDNPPSQAKVVLGALLGIARSNNIPLWQFPLFCYWYAAQGVGKVGNGLTGSLLNKWFGKIFQSEEMLLDAVGMIASSGGRGTFAENGTNWDIRMEMPPLKITF